MTIDDAVHTLGEPFVLALADRIHHARTKHPTFAENARDGSFVVQRECLELIKACAHETREREQDEALDVATTAFRHWKGEWDYADVLTLGDR